MWIPPANALQVLLAAGPQHLAYDRFSPALCDCHARSPCLAGKTLLARAVANRTDACFIRVIGSELVQKYVGEGARMVRELFQMARSKKACLIFFDEIDAIGGARFDDGAGKLANPLFCTFDFDSLLAPPWGQL